MKMKKRKPSGREKDDASIRLLEQLMDKLYSDHVGIARRAAFSLSWMQEDGFDILKEALFSDTARRTKSAAAYGLRKMRGRMKKPALEALTGGVNNPDSTTAKVCENALHIGTKEQATGKQATKSKNAKGRFEIRELRGRPKQRRVREKVQRRPNHFRR